MSQAPNVLMVHPTVPVKSVAEFIAYLKGQSGQAQLRLVGQRHVVASGGRVVQGDDRQRHAARAVSRHRSGLIDLIAGQVQVYFTSPVGILQYIQDGKLRALAVTTVRAFRVLCPNLPAVAATVPGFEVTTWFGVGAPKATPGTIVDLLNREINAGAHDPKIRARLAELGGAAFIATPAEMAAFLAAEVDRWGRAVKFSGAKVD